jgi:C-methyltransferase C-terminal domain/Putative zinc binding domain
MRCRCCESARIEQLLDYGSQPVSSRYGGYGWKEYSQRLGLAICHACGTLQLSPPWPEEELTPRADWITYSEPEAHLPQSAAIAQSIARSRNAMGMSYKDDSLLQRMATMGFATDLPEGLVFARHVLEHEQQPLAFMQELRDHCGRDGIAMVEVPSAVRLLRRGLHHLIWEDHQVYFTATTFDRFLRYAGWHTLRRIAFDGEPEDLEVAFVVPAARNMEFYTTELDLRIARDFAAKFELQRRWWREKLSGQSTKAAVFGAGHHATHLINFYGLAPYIAVVVDDNEHKVGRTMPGSRLPIVGSWWLRDNRSPTVVSTLTAAKTAKVKTQLPEFRGRWLQSY